MSSLRTSLLGLAVALVSACSSTPSDTTDSSSTDHGNGSSSNGSSGTGAHPSTSGSQTANHSSSNGGGSSGSTSTGGSSQSASTTSSGAGTTSHSGSGSTTSGSTASSTTSSTSHMSSGSSTSTGPVGQSGLPAPATTGVAKPSGTVGGLQVLNWAGFKAAVSYNFDDANSSQVSNYNTLHGLGVPYTFYLIGSKISQATSTWVQATKDGNEMANHTQDHSDQTLNNGGGQTDVDQCDSSIKSALGVTAYTFAEPNGTAGWETPAMVHHFMSRGVSDGLMMPGNETLTPPNNLHCYIPRTSAPTSDFNGEIDGARSGGGWRVILVHGFTGGSDGAYQPVNLSDYTAGVTYAKSFPDLWIGTMENVGAYWRGQNAFNKATKTTSGSSTTYTWTLPANFPPGKYLRVTVTGGTITQNGTALTWDTHGYYEIALDVGSLTLSP